MNFRTSFLKTWLSCLLSFLLLAGGAVRPAAAQKKERKPIVISFGQPNIWSLEQAHYLLARMHAQNLDLKAKDIGQNELDPNAVNATRINILKSLLEINAQFDQGVGFQNEQLVRNQRFNQDRRFELTAKRDGMRDNSLQLSRDVSRLQFERARMEKDKASSEDLKLKDAEIEQKKADQAAADKEISFYNDELKTLGAEPAGTPQAPSLSGTPFDKSKLPSSILDEVVKDDVKKLLESAHDPRLDASTVLDNHVQMQYEIIAKQLTLLRDEVGPGERLVFLELPQSIYTTPGSGDEKMAQSWWHVNGYTKTEPLVRQLLELYEVEAKWQKIIQVPAFKPIAAARRLATAPCPAKGDAAQQQQGVQAPQAAPDPELVPIFEGFAKEHEAARAKALRSLFREGDATFARVEQRGARDTSELVEAIRKVISVKSEAAPAARGEKGREDPASTHDVIDSNTSTVADQKAVVSAAGTRDQQQHDNVEKIKSNLLRLLSDLLSDNPPVICDPPQYDFASGMEFVRLDDQAGLAAGAGSRDIERRTGRSVDIIPRQSSLNVNDIQETVKATGILAAFKFLFGFAGQVNYQRQREQYEQFLHQELYASGFGKGNRDFGWTFGALPGTKRVAPGVRTTYAALVVPDDAESIILSARGCYFPRKGYQPLDYEDGADRDWGRESRFGSRNCGEAQTYIMPIPGGGGSNNFWITNVDYQPVKKEGQRAVVSIRGSNFSSQIGVLVDGVPLTPSVGLAQPLLAAARNGEGCKGVCGEMERIDPQQIVISFSRPGTGTPVITLMGPGKSVDINSIDLTINPNPADAETLKKRKLNSVKPAIFEEPDKAPEQPKPPAKLGIIDFSVFRVSPKSRQAFAVLTGTNFEPATQVFINGKPLPGGPDMETRPGGGGRRRKGGPAPPKLSEYKEYKSPSLYRLIFELPPDDNLTVTVMQGDVVTSRSVANPMPVKITKASSINSDPGDKDAKPASFSVSRSRGLLPHSSSR
jgi:hypothetical protein